MAISAIASSVNPYAASGAAPARTASAQDTQEKQEPQAKPGAKAELTSDQLKQIDKLKARDQQVRQHEMAHLSAAGGLATSGPTYTYQRGPDGINYAIGGEVNIDTSPGRTPQETLERARTIQAAALAPADPSGPDRAIAARAQQMAQQASQELAAQQSNPDSTPQGAPGQAETAQQSAVRRAYNAVPAQQPVLNVYA
ncbi:putative metalloprotease CJM1_0395 family protein [Massilia sp. erpn]|uniref:putative metalloprotease CJM1_0395 family protein n=1 Tax=Massilia sp. erpn TaxID=2738142 RepID=UPI002101D6AF|nr:putative metalloprotease CJM1_0395 family protein [Massilia sp. erpn]UTY58876.1 catalase [Massilia sp. erpn]